MQHLALLTLLALTSLASASVLCGTLPRAQNARICYEVLGAPMCLESDGASFIDAATQADARLVAEYARLSSLVAPGDQQACMFAWRIAACGTVFSPEERSRSTRSNLCQSTCDALVAACGVSFDVACDSAQPAPCAGDYADVARAMCTSNHEEPTTTPTARATAAPFGGFGFWRNSATERSANFLMISAAALASTLA